jgi:hypothetical protein
MPRGGTKRGQGTGPATTLNDPTTETPVSVAAEKCLQGPVEEPRLRGKGQPCKGGECRQPFFGRASSRRARGFEDVYPKSHVPFAHRPFKRSRLRVAGGESRLPRNDGSRTGQPEEKACLRARAGSGSHPVYLVAKLAGTGFPVGCGSQPGTERTNTVEEITDTSKYAGNAIPVCIWQRHAGCILRIGAQFRNKQMQGFEGQAVQLEEIVPVPPVHTCHHACGERLASGSVKGCHKQQNTKTAIRVRHKGKDRFGTAGKMREYRMRVPAERFGIQPKPGKQVRSALNLHGAPTATSRMVRNRAIRRRRSNRGRGARILPQYPQAARGAAARPTARRVSARW